MIVENADLIIEKRGLLCMVQGKSKLSEDDKRMANSVCRLLPLVSRKAYTPATVGTT